MKFIVSSNQLLKQLQTLGGVINNSNTLPILDNFLFELQTFNLHGHDGHHKRGREPGKDANHKHVSLALLARRNAKCNLL